jgi:hypothetical protein
MDPSTSADRDGLSGAVDPPSVLLVEVPRFDDRDTSICIDLLTAAPAADEKLLIVSVTETIGKTHRRWDDHVGEHPDEFAVVSASFVEDGPGGGTADGVGGASEANWLVSPASTIRGTSPASASRSPASWRSGPAVRSRSWSACGR